MTLRKVIFDTDPGVDDAMALLFLHHAPEVELAGITTTFGNGTIDQTTFNALYIAERFGIAAPVARGAGAPLVGAAMAPPDFVHGRNALGDVALPAQLRARADPRPAYRFIIDAVRAAPHEISIVAVGRMTNLALTLREEPGIASLVKEIVVMGGAFGIAGVQGNVTPAAEANIIGDPEAADEIAAADWPITFVGLDVTQKTRMSTDFLADLAEKSGESGHFVWDISRFYEAFHQAGGVSSIYVHDSSAVAYFLKPELFTTRSGAIRVSTDGITRGMTVQKPDTLSYPPGAWDGRPSHRVCTSVDSDGLLDLYRSTLIEAR
ncbi:nucleoside hydrolase [Kumtagia ephedrae]|uniref:Nucleoside hydrolase n=1 Tax=Kumtagia ephedrae TaxID=2116701 RepID=A0A2P7RTV5_9HYPH|nr:nucleoside hydrolase [Mesorhizobium ephedrae]PSJ53626.1 nucleoside hydrolase [Mesorhizobium ephedrae]